MKKKPTSKYRKLLSLFIFLIVVGSQNLIQAQPTLNWVKQIGDSISQETHSINVDSNGNSYIIGNFYGTLDFDPGSGVFNLTSVSTNTEMYVCKLDSNGNFIWAKKFGGTNWSYAREVRVDYAENVYILGRFSGTIDFDPGTSIFNLSTNSGLDGVFINKLDPNGNFIWAKSASGVEFNAMNNPMGMAIDSNNNVFVTGIFKETLDFGSGDAIYSPSTDLFIFKIDASGNFGWAKTPGTPNTFVNGYGPYNNGYSINVDLNNNLLVTGYFRGTIDFDLGAGVYNVTSSGTSSNTDLYILKLDNNGDFIWVKKIGNATAEGYGIDVTSDLVGNVIVAGAIRVSSGGGMVDMNPGSGTSYFSFSLGAYSSFLMKLDPNGNFLWANQVAENTSQSEAFNVCTDKCGNVYTIGRFMGGTGDFDPGVGTFNMTPIYQDIFISELDANGSFVWAGQFGIGSTFSDKNNDVFVDGNNNIYFAGGIGNGSNATSPPNDFDPGANVYNVTTMGYNDIFVAKLSTLPPTVSLVAASSTICAGNPTTITASGALTYVWSPSTGLSSTTDSVVTASPSITTTYTVIGSNGSCSGSDTTTITITVNTLTPTAQTFTECQGFSVTVGTNTYSTTGNYIDTLATSTGCDSIINTNLTILPNSSGTDIQTVCGLYNWIDGNMYTASTNTPTYTIVGGAASGCDSVVNLNLIINPKPVINLTNDLTILQGISTNLVATGGGTYLWSPSTDLSCDTCSTTIANPLFTTNYCVEVTASNGCVDSKCVNVNVDVQCGELFVPNVFSPNGDGNNDYLEVKVNPTCVTSFNIKIFDRWGEKVFESDDITNSWDGTYKGNPLNNAVFIYYLNIGLIDSESGIFKKGDVNIVK